MKYISLKIITMFIMFLVLSQNIAFGDSTAAPTPPATSSPSASPTPRCPRLVEQQDLSLSDALQPGDETIIVTGDTDSGVSHAIKTILTWMNPDFPSYFCVGSCEDMNECCRYTKITVTGDVFIEKVWDNSVKKWVFTGKITGQGKKVTITCECDCL